MKTRPLNLLPTNADDENRSAESPLRALRLRSGLSVRELATLADVASSTISRIERGDRGIGARSRRRIAVALGCHERDLFEIEARASDAFTDLLAALSKLIEAGAHDIAADTAEHLAARLRTIAGGVGAGIEPRPRFLRDIEADPAGASQIPDFARARSMPPRSIDDLKVFSGRLEQHEELGDDAADPRHAQLIETWRQCDGELTTGFLDHLAALGLSELTSIYDDGIKVRHIGDGTVFWTEAQRRAVIGRELFELAAPPEYTRLTHDALVDATRTGQVTLRLVTFNSGIHCVTYKRAAFWFPRSRLVVGSPALQPLK
ncbi:hypothetical protein GCM10011611_31180 [Aliidongia dinghuensis]|uniref:HTH cro/C1-type domain-containing protein n=1 Tax=Aliidongia dinghuensis TaxID=1867774 RepID=A0A8J2YUA8_9PROT|nr:helix-turn-helix transcriptional regulator [Aliidongia dinghuensis]GGF22868.1 hypothetical protein GCM10011611_31180 [Aliidongia dinghuensis]